MDFKANRKALMASTTNTWPIIGSLQKTTMATALWPNKRFDMAQQWLCLCYNFWYLSSLSSAKQYEMTKFCVA